MLCVVSQKVNNFSPSLSFQNTVPVRKTQHINNWTKTAQTQVPLNHKKTSLRTLQSASNIKKKKHTQLFLFVKLSKQPSRARSTKSQRSISHWPVSGWELGTLLTGASRCAIQNGVVEREEEKERQKLKAVQSEK